MNDFKPAKLSQKWTERWPFGLFQKTIEVDAEQIKGENLPLRFDAHIAKVRIKVNGKQKFEEEIPYAFPSIEAALPLQILLLAIEPGSQHRKWQPVLKKFCSFYEVCRQQNVKIFWKKLPLSD